LSATVTHRPWPGWRSVQHERTRQRAPAAQSALAKHLGAPHPTAGIPKQKATLSTSPPHVHEPDSKPGHATISKLPPPSQLPGLAQAGAAVTIAYAVTVCVGASSVVVAAVMPQHEHAEA